jgi:hypothetical protein
MQGIEHEARPAGSAMNGTPATAERPIAAERPVWNRTHLSWFLIALSLVPGVVAAAFRSEWSGLPAGVRMTAYIVSGILIVAACAVMLQQDSGPASSGPDSIGLDASP